MDTSLKRNVYDEKLLPTFPSVIVESIDQVPVISLINVLKKLKMEIQPWMLELMDGREAIPCSFNQAQAYKELSRRRQLATTSARLADVAYNLSTTNVINISPSGKVEIADDKTGKPLKVETFSGYVIPKNDKSAKEEVKATVIANAYAFPIVSTPSSASATTKKTSLVTVDVEVAETLSFPLFKSYLTQLPEDCKRNIYVTNCAKAIKQNRAFKESILRLSPVGVDWKDEKGNFELDSKSYGKVVKVNNCKTLYNMIIASRAVRGADYSARHEVHSGYYYGLIGRGLFHVCYIVQDILALGSSLGINMLELNSVDSIFNNHVCQSLVAQGWLIRIVGATSYPERDDEESGIFSYFSSNKMYLRFCPLNERQPQMTSGVLTMTTDVMGLLKRKFKCGLDDYGIPFSYAYIQDSMRSCQQDGFFLYPTAHAHSGHVIVVKRELADDNDYNFGFDAYLRRISLANTWKNHYVYTRTPFIISDPFAHQTDFFIRNREKKMIFIQDKIEFEGDVPEFKERIYAPNSEVPKVPIVKPVKIKKQEDLLREAGLKVIEAKEQKIKEKEKKKQEKEIPFDDSDAELDEDASDDDEEEVDEDTKNMMAEVFAQVQEIDKEILGEQSVEIRNPEPVMDESSELPPVFEEEDEPSSTFTRKRGDNNKDPIAVALEFTRSAFEKKGSDVTRKKKK